MRDYYRGKGKMESGGELYPATLEQMIKVADGLDSHVTQLQKESSDTFRDYMKVKAQLDARQLYPWSESLPVQLPPSRTRRIYIAGPMSGIEDHNFPAFNAQADILRKEGWTVLNPADHGVVEGAEWGDYLRHDLAGLVTCEAIYLLPGWEGSRGARLEVTVAEQLGLMVLSAESFDSRLLPVIVNMPSQQWLVAKQEALDLGGERRSLGYFVPGDLGPFPSADSCVEAIQEAKLPLGWVAVSLDTVMPGAYLPAAEAPRGTQGEQALTIWKGGQYKVWSGTDAMYAIEDPGHVVNIPLPDLWEAVQREANNRLRLYLSVWDGGGWSVWATGPKGGEHQVSPDLSCRLDVLSVLSADASPVAPEMKGLEPSNVIAWQYTDAFGSHVTDDYDEIQYTPGIEEVTPLTPAKVSFQSRVENWMMACFGPVISNDRTERNHRFLEEALELVQACDCSREHALELVNYVYSRPVGERDQEVGGVAITLTALCLAHGIDLEFVSEEELSRIWGKVGAIREKQKSKPRFGALPGAYP